MCQFLSIWLFLISLMKEYKALEISNGKFYEEMQKFKDGLALRPQVGCLSHESLVGGIYPRFQPFSRKREFN